MNYKKLSVLIKEKPPYFMGSQLRGAFGYALKKVTCINPSFSCDGCFAKDNCLYYQFYEQKNSFHQYRFDFELECRYYDFNLYLFESATQQLPYVVSALYMMLTQVGLGREKQTFKDFDIFLDDKSILQHNQIKLPQDTTKTFQIDKICRDVTVKFTTPLRIKKDNRFVRDDNIELKDIVNSIYQREMQLLGYGYKKFPHEIKGDIVEKKLNYKELMRKSNRQKTTMNLGGVMGKISIKNLNKECYEVLKLGELIGVGKSTVFGLGKIEVEEIG